MRLTYSDRKEIGAIIAKFTEEDHERIYAEVERDIKQMKSSPLTSVLRDLCSDHVAFVLASDETDWQVAVDEFLWDRLTDYYKFQYALAVFMARHQTWEAA
jgi:hypothetical protein